jgi:hypothetical protein
MHPWPSLTVQDHLLECPHPSLARSYFPGDNTRPWTTIHQHCSSQSRSWLLYVRRNLEESSISLLSISHFCVFFLLILVCSLPGDSCMFTTQAGSITKTLVFHTYYFCAGTIVGSIMAPTAITSTQCALIMVSISVLTPSIALGSNG